MIELIKNCNYIWVLGYLHYSSVRNEDCSLLYKMILTFKILQCIICVKKSANIYVIVTFNLDNLNMYCVYFKRGKPKLRVYVTHLFVS